MGYRRPHGASAFKSALRVMSRSAKSMRRAAYCCTRCASGSVPAQAVTWNRNRLHAYAVSTVSTVPWKRGFTSIDPGRVAADHKIDAKGPRAAACRGDLLGKSNHHSALRDGQTGSPTRRTRTRIRHCPGGAARLPQSPGPRYRLQYSRRWPGSLLPLPAGCRERPGTGLPILFLQPHRGAPRCATLRHPGAALPLPGIHCRQQYGGPGRQDLQKNAASPVYQGTAPRFRGASRRAGTGKERLSAPEVAIKIKGVPLAHLCYGIGEIGKILKPIRSRVYHVRSWSQKWSTAHTS